MADDNAGVEVGGDGSVAWKVDVKHVRRDTIVSKSCGSSGYLQQGVDETDPGQHFTIGIKVPKENGADLAAALAAAAKDASEHAREPEYLVKFRLVIEPHNENQIQINWKSSEPTRKRRAAPTMDVRTAGRKAAIASAKKVTKKAVKPAKTAAKKKAGKKR